MPVLTPAMFTDAVDVVWEGAKRSFDRNKQIHSHLVAFDAQATSRAFLQAHPDNPDLQGKDVVAVPGPWTDHLDLIEAEFRAHRAVAAILIAEAWIGHDDVAVEMFRMGIDPHEHPFKDEMVFTVGQWPRARLSTQTMARAAGSSLSCPPRAG